MSENLVGDPSPRGGDDCLDGGDGFDILYGDGVQMSESAVGGDDTLTGGGGADAFHFAGAFGQDTVTDFSGVAGEGDTLVFHGYTADDLTMAPLPGGGTVIAAGADAQVTVLGGPVSVEDIVFL